MRLIPTFAHGFLDYAVGLALIFAPEIFNFSDIGGAAAATPRVIGIAGLLLALVTRYELGVFKLLPMPIHLKVDFFAGAVLLCSPLLFGFNNAPAHAWLPHVVAGTAIVFVAMSSRAAPAPLSSTLSKPRRAA